MQQDDERQNEYDDVFVTRLQLIWGEGFLSPGGPEEVRRMVKGLSIAEREVLDIGCGIGGVDVLLATDHRAKRVLGVDVERPLLIRAEERVRQLGLSDRIQFRLVALGSLPLDDASFDVVFSKDAMMHIPDKRAMFADVYRILRPGGVLVASDWLKSPASQTPALDAYREAAEYSAKMVSPEATEQWLQDAGFESVELRDITDWLLPDSRKTHERICGELKERATELIGQQRYERWVRISQTLIGSLEARELRPVHLVAQKA
ncbi:hypothetical protein MNBD_CHLOROFLEXI01-122 [hydrothermal vent metagenome]|uniref:Polyketide synthase-like methyltransferase domain-containing protein n=1 Tax=hydrothermal vent metagenome TaxID=652676 RepID=A0A3B0VJ28_9ZZZZ